jgi:pimeloyl-ACP methyl ester carboxylesterase
MTKVSTTGQRLSTHLTRWALVAVAGACMVVPSTAPVRSAEGAVGSCAGRGHVTFRAADNTRLVGHAFGRGTTAVVLAHQTRSSMCQWLRYARRLASSNYRVFVFDFRNHGLSQQVGFGSRSTRFAADVVAAAKYVRANGARKVFLVGASMGGAAVIVGGANIRPPVTGIVSLSAPASFGGVDAAPAAPRVTVPVLFLASSEDGGGRFAQDAQALYEATASPEKTIEILPGTGHGVSLVSSPGGARNLVEEFLASH